MLPRVCDVMTTGQVNDTLTLIQVLSVVLILIRIKKQVQMNQKREIS